MYENVQCIADSSVYSAIVGPIRLLQKMNEQPIEVSLISVGGYSVASEL